MFRFWVFIDIIQFVWGSFPIHPKGERLLVMCCLGFPPMSPARASSVGFQWPRQSLLRLLFQLSLITPHEDQPRKHDEDS